MRKVIKIGELALHFYSLNWGITPDDRRNEFFDTCSDLFQVIYAFSELLKTIIKKSMQEEAPKFQQSCLREEVKGYEGIVLSDFFPSQSRIGTSLRAQ